MPRSGFGRTLEVSLGVLRDEAPASFARLETALRDRPVFFDVDGAPFRLSFYAGSFRLEEAEHRNHGEVEVALSKATVLALLDGMVSLEDAVWTDRLRLYGKPARLVGFFDALLFYLRGAVRCPSFPELLADYRSDTTGGPDSRED